ncbi:CRP-like cAMP-binding protein [Spirosoma oryzae]|uniref:CRP-like cAMP-binding protein n=1 Tax=Spirosoma oryzae TaxID=1469603 RepID=A0A2T0RXH2_9BACT|nr:response regulator [Spirosoma oryzae]PRY25889.1 CRP-like cAMP-binding protein [Spirosoma oryzae]
MKTILVIEDKKEVRENITEILKLAQYRVVQASDGRQGVALARSVGPDLILCDIMMPELDGYGVLHILAKDPNTARTPFIFLTAKVAPEHLRNGMNLGADDYLTKPIDNIDLLAAVELRLKKVEQMNQPVEQPGLADFLNALHQVDGCPYSTLRYSKKQILYAEGDTPANLYYIRSGQVKHVKTDASANVVITALSGAGDFVGLPGLLSDVPCTESAEVLHNAEICLIPQAELLTLLTSHADIGAYFMRLLASDVRQRDERLLKLAYQPVRKRVVEALLLVYRKFYSLPDDLVITPLGQDVRSAPFMTLSRENWAQLVGASMETVIRVLSDLRAEGMIKLSGSQITLLDIDRLTRLKH